MSQYESTLVKLTGLPRKIGTRIARNGARNTIGWCWHQLDWRLKEARLGIQTREFAYGIVVPDRGLQHGYEPIDYKCFQPILNELSLDAANTTFLEYGCGMGRAVVLAATLPLKRVIGIEIDPALADIAIRNVEQARRRGRLRCEEVEVLATDACQFEVPPDVNRVFLFNSFGGEILDQTMQRILESLMRHPRDFGVYYIYPIEQSDWLSPFPWLKPVRTLPTGYWDHVHSRYYQADLAEVDDQSMRSVQVDQRGVLVDS